ncbi:hypothetical protein [Streptomyces sp. NPDC002853]
MRNGDDGQPVVELRPCEEGETLSGVRLGSWAPEEGEGEEEAADDEASRASAGSSSASAPAQAGTADPDGDRADQDDSGWETGEAKNRGSVVFPLFSPPPNWHAQTYGEQTLLPDRTYSLSFRGSDSYKAHVYFTADDLASLRPGQVWADDRAMSTEDFTELVDDRC